MVWPPIRIHKIVRRNGLAEFPMNLCHIRSIFHSFSFFFLTRFPSVYHFFKSDYLNITFPMSEDDKYELLMKSKKKVIFRRRAFYKQGPFHSEQRVTNTSSSRRGQTYVKEVEKCERVVFAASKSDKAQRCTKFLFIYYNT